MRHAITTSLALLCLGFLSLNAWGAHYWLDSRFDTSATHYRTMGEACAVGEMQRRIDSYRVADKNPNYQYRYFVDRMGDFDGFGYSCKGEVDRKLPLGWFPIEVVDTQVYDNGGANTCNIPGYSDPDTGQCGPPKCTNGCCGGGGCGGFGGGGASGNGGSGVNGSNPIHTASGNKFQRETDIAGNGVFPLQWTRYYNSNRIYDSAITPLGIGWTHSYLGRIVGYPSAETTSNPPIDHARIYRPDGRIQTFTLSGTHWQSDADVSERLAYTVDADGAPSSWTYTTNDDAIERYDGPGRLLSITNREGFTQTLSYLDAAGNPQNNVQQITDPNGRTLTLGYTSGQLTKVTDSNGQIFSYTYDTASNLSTVVYPDTGGGTKTRTYLYNEAGQTSGATLPNALTGITDENSQRYASWGYTADQRANLSVHGLFSGGTIDRTALTFDVAGTTTVTDALNQKRIFGFAVNYGVARVAALDQPCDDCGEQAKSKTYDANGYPNLVTDFRGIQARYVYDARGLENQRIQAVGQPEERTIGTTWDTNLRVPLTIVESGRTITFTRNSRGQTLTKTLTDTRSPPPPGGLEAPRTWTTTYCDAVDATQCPLVGLPLSANGPRTDVADLTTYTYRLTDDPATPKTYRKGDLWKVTNALGQVAETVAYDGAGRVTRSKDSNGVITDLTYHPRGWLLTRTVRANADGSASANDATTTFVYDGVGNITRVTQPDGVFLDYHYDSAHRLDKITDTLGNHIDYTLDALGHRAAEKTFDVSDAVNPRKLLGRTYNQLARLEKQLDALGRYSQFTYDGNGNRTDQTDPLSIKTHWTFDALNRLKTQVQDYMGTDASTANATTAYQNDARDNLTQITDPNNLITTYTFDGINNLDTLQSPDTGTTAYTQDAAGNRITQTDARGITATLSYDALNRLTGITYPTASLNLHYGYDESNAITGCPISYPTGRLTHLTDESGTTTYCYDQRGNITRKTQAAVGYRFVTSYSYTLADRLSGITYPSGAQITYTRDSDGRITSVSATPAGGSATPLLTSIAYLPFGPATTYTFASGSQVLSKTLDSNYWMTDVTSNALNLHFRRDAIGDIDRLGNTTGATPPSEQYRYDALYRLTHTQDPMGSDTEAETYTLSGDRLSKTIAPAATQTYSYTPMTHHLNSVAGNARTFDANGNTTKTTGAATLDFTYNDRNRLASVKRNGLPIASYAINAKGERVYKTTTYPANDTRWFSYNESGQLIGEYTQNGFREYVWVDQTPVAILDTTGIPLKPADQVFANGFELPPTPSTTIYYVHTDQLDTPRAVTTPTGTTVWNWPWQGNPFGEAVPTGTMTMNLRYPGQYADAETGLNYNNRRDYETQTGRYIESDPIGLSGGINTYSYVGSKPFELVDNYGLAAECGTNCCASIEWSRKEGGTVGGQTRCCDGRPVACVNPNICDGFSATACVMLKKCAQRHEQYHVDHHTNCSGQSDGPAIPPDKNSNECEAYREESRCLSITSCSGSTQCEAEMRKIQEKNLSQKKIYCSMAGM